MVMFLLKRIELVNPDYLGYVRTIRHACRGLIFKDDKILLSYEEKKDVYMIPGGGVENNESLSDCCKREVFEETGVVCTPVVNYLEIEELFDTMRHINHYFACEVIEETEQRNLTQRELEVGLILVWIPIKEALNIFGKYEKFFNIDKAMFGLYRREFLAIRTWLNKEH